MITIIGAGLAGLLAANMLRHEKNVSVLEAQSNLPNNHSAVLRFRSTVVGDTLGIDFKPVNMIKTYLPWRNVIADSLQYAKKNTKMMRSDRSIIDGLVSDKRYIAPPDLIERMARGASIAYDIKIINLNDLDNKGAIISTMPMPALMQVLDYKDRPQFSFAHGYNIIVKLSMCEAYVSLLVPDPRYTFSRLSITDDTLIIEIPQEKFNTESVLKQALELLGISEFQVLDWETVEQRYAKILPIDDEARKRFLHWATINHGIYSLGRFATWRPGLLLDDLVKDVRLINRWIKDNSKYDIARHR